jgi:hypothetical protein
MSDPSPPDFISITLFCWVLGLSNRAFSIDIKNTQTVDHLKDAIVKKKSIAFEHVDADQLDLWMVRSIDVMSVLSTEPS